MATEAPPIHPPKLVDTSAKTFKTQEPNRKPPASVLAGEDFGSDPAVDSTIDSTMLPPAAKVSTEDKRGNVTEVKTETPTTEKKDEKPIEPPVEQVKPKVEVKKEEAPKKEEPKEEPKVEPKREEKKAPKVDLSKPVMPSSKEEGSQKQEKVVRDYKGYSEEEVAHFKQMSDSAYAFTKKIIDSNKQNQQQAGDIYLQNPQAYTLTPEYNELNRKLYCNQLEQQIYEKQLLDIKEGKDWAPLSHFEDKNGEIIPVYGATQKATPQAELSVQRCYNAIAGVTQQNLAARQNLTQQFNQRVNQDNQIINQMRAKQFGWVANPEVLKNKVNTLLGERTIAEVRDDFLKQVPAYRRSDILAQASADMFATIVILTDMVNNSKNEASVEKTKKEEVLMAEPLAEHGGSENGSKKSNDFDMSGLPE